MMTHGAYIGGDDRLRGKTALLREKEGRMLAQFDDMTLPKAFGWWAFAPADFRLDEPEGE